MNITHEQNGKKGVFFINHNNKREAEMTYTWAGDDKIIIDHTEVSDVFKGQKVGYKLVEAAVHFAREKQIKILPLCPFANYVMNKIDAYNDVKF